MQQWITGHGYDSSAGAQQILMDDGIHTPPTKANIWAAMQWLIKGAQPGDALFFHFSGHGGQVKDISGDEADGMDEVSGARRVLAGARAGPAREFSDVSGGAPGPMRVESKLHLAKLHFQSRMC